MLIESDDKTNDGDGDGDDESYHGYVLVRAYTHTHARMPAHTQVRWTSTSRHIPVHLLLPRMVADTATGMMLGLGGPGLGRATAPRQHASFLSLLLLLTQPQA